MTRYDPTRSIVLRSAMTRLLTKRFRMLRSKMIYLILTEDALDLSIPDPIVDNEVTGNVGPWALLSAADKILSLKAWINKEMSSGSILDEVNDKVRQGYLKGADKGFSRTRKLSLRPKKITQVLRREFMVSQFGRNTDTLVNLQSLALSDLEGITKTMETQIVRSLTEGLLKGDSKEQIAKSLADRVNKIGVSRAKMLAHDSIVKAHAEGALDAMERLGVQDISVEVEWSTMKDNKVCPQCVSLDGVIIPLQKARGLFPRHPYCRCSPIPSEESVNKRKLRAAVKRSAKASSESDQWTIDI